MASEYGRYTATSGAISSNTTTTLVTPAAGRKVYVYWVGVDVSAAGTTSAAKINASTTTGLILGHYNTTAVGHQESYTAFSFKDYAGFELPVGENLQVVTTGGAAATLTITVIYEIRG